MTTPSTGRRGPLARRRKRPRLAFWSGAFARAAGAVALSLAFLPAGAGVGAAQADATLRLEKQGWFWRPAARINVDPGSACPPPSVAPCPSSQQQPNPIEQDHFAVGFSGAQAQAEREQAVALFQFDLSWMAPDTEVSSASVVLEESNDDATHRNRRPGLVVNSKAPGTILRACLVTDFWGEGQPGLWLEKPPVDLGVCSRGVREEPVLDGRIIPIWRFDVTPMAKVWGRDPGRNYGIAIVPAADASGEFYVSFHGNTRLVNVDPVTRLEEVTPVERVTGTMKFKAPPVIGLGGDEGAGTDGPGTGVLGAQLAPILGTPEVSFGNELPGPALTSPVNRTLRVRRSSGVLSTSGQAQVPAYMWIGLPLGLWTARMLALLFVGGGPATRVNRVAAAYRSRRAQTSS